jgi:hypothetical protein
MSGFWFVPSAIISRARRSGLSAFGARRGRILCLGSSSFHEGYLHTCYELVHYILLIVYNILASTNSYTTLASTITSYYSSLV